jgi:hypothetical protein
MIPFGFLFFRGVVFSGGVDEYIFNGLIFCCYYVKRFYIAWVVLSLQR